MPKIIISRGDFLVKKVSVPDTILAFTVGCEQGNDILVEDDRVSFFHLQFEKQGRGYYVRDLQSESGTFVNGRRITSRTLLRNRDIIGIGGHSLTFENEGDVSLEPDHREDLQIDSLPSFDDTNNELDNIAGMPSLNNLNSWLHDDHNYSDNGPAIPTNGTSSLPEPESEEVPYPVEVFESEPTDISQELAPPPKRTPDPRAPSLRYPKPEEEPLGRSSQVVLNFKTGEMLKPGAADDYEEPDKAVLPTVTEEASQSQTQQVGQSNYYLLGVNGYYLGRKFRLSMPETRIGRDKRINDIVIKRNSRGNIDPSVSRRQATIVCKHGRFYLSDKRSKSRTYLNQRQLDAKDEVQIKPGDEIEIVSDRQSHILRLVSEGDWDFSFPVKAGVWHLRYRTKLVLAISAIFIVIAGYWMIESFLTRNTIASKPNPLQIHQEVWYADLDNGASALHEDRDISGNYAIADFNSDGRADLVFNNANRRLKSVNGAKRATLWSNEDFQVAPGPLAAEDLNQDNNPDVIAVSDDWRLRAIDGRWGIEIWTSPILAGPLIGPPAIGDFNGDRLKDLAIVSSTRVLYIGFSGLGNSRWIQVPLDAEVNGAASAAYLGQDTHATIALGTEDGRVLLVDGLREKIVGELNINEELNKATGRFDQDNRIRHPVSFADLDGDEVTDLLIMATNGSLVAMNGSDMRRLWYHLEQATEPVSQSQYGVALGDLDGDGLTDVVVLSPNGRLRAFKGSGLSRDRKMQLWEKNPNETSGFSGNPAVVDINKNGTMDVVANQNGSIAVFEGANGQLLWQESVNQAPLNGHTLVGQLGPNDKTGFLARKKDGTFYHYVSNCRYFNTPVLWGQAYGDSRNSSLAVSKRQATGPYTARIGIAFIVMLLAAGLPFLISFKRRQLSQSLL